MTHHAGAGSGDGSRRISSIHALLDCRGHNFRQKFPRGKYIGKRVGQPATDEAEHFIKCPACAGWIDCRDLAQVPMRLREFQQSLAWPAATMMLARTYR
jgi:hypothetical protein